MPRKQAKSNGRKAQAGRPVATIADLHPDPRNARRQLLRQVYFSMTRFAESQAVGDFIAKIGMRGPRLDVMSVQGSAAFVAMLAGIIVALIYSLAPFAIGIANHCYFPFFLIPAIFCMFGTTPELWRGLPIGIGRAELNSNFPSLTLFLVLHLFSCLVAALFAGLLSASFRSHLGNAGYAGLLESIACPEGRRQVGFPFGRIMRTAAGTILGWFADAASVIVIGLFQFKRLIALGADDRNALSNRLILAGGRAGLTASVLEAGPGNLKCFFADRASALN